MQRIRTMRHVATSQTIPSYRTCASALKPQQQVQDQARMMTGYAQMILRDQQRQEKSSG